MRKIQISMISAMLLVSVQAFADGAKKGGPCTAYFQTCKGDSTVTAAKGREKGKAMHECIAKAAAADTANGQACTDEMAKHKGHHQQ